ncbi:BatD family protein [uncultured Brachyspira sp.]|uniref:BatD family protein n=1 Tax=uncultured Brachyspira sp. TaxID=221953 RepID=UPI00260BADA5|nr:BatD family protein [uncultured Brachyspira sp.]
MIRIGNIFIKTILALLFIAYSSLFSQTKINAKISDTKVGIGEMFTVSVTIDNSSARVLIDDIDGLMLRGTSQSVNMMYSSGTFKSIKTYNFTYIADREGKYIFDKITIKINNRTYISNPVEIEIIDSPTRNNDNYKPDSNKFDNFMNYADDIYVDNNINKKEVYLYEPVYINQKAYSHIPVTVLGFSKIPDRTDFISYSDSSDYNSFTEIIDGKRVSSIPLKREVLYPVKEGYKSISTYPFTFEKEGMFYDRVQYGEETFSINVIPLPDKEGFENFSGGVGNFVFSMKANKTNIAVGEELLITMEVLGEGNTSIITMPEINDNITNYFSVYQPKVYETNWFDNNKMIGKKTKEYILVAKSEGSFAISNINFCYFSPNDKTYTNIYSLPINLIIQGSKVNDSSFVNNNEKDISSISIRDTYLKEDKYFKILDIKIVYFYIIIFFAVCIFIFNYKKINNIKFSFAKDNNDNRIDNIFKYYNSNNRKEYCKSVEDILLTALKNKFHIKDDNILYEKLNNYIDDEKAYEIKNIIDICRFELYSGKSSDNEDYHTKSIELIKYIKELKIKK